ncbi:sortase [Candidatus Daviesbacteria bacterium]|nr:sortase [Candidatus Daviesbacteria bacterium]
MQTFNSKSKITLFDRKVHKIPQGRIYFKRIVQERETLKQEKKVSPVKIAAKVEAKNPAAWFKVRYIDNSFKNKSRKVVKDNKILNKVFNYKHLATAFFTLAIFGFVSLATPILVAEVTFRANKLFGEKYDANKVKKLSAYDFLLRKYDPNFRTQAKAISSDFRIAIPKINVESAVIPSVDATNETEYVEKLKLGVAHAKGSYVPGEGGTVFLFSHSTDTPANILQYNAKFYAVKDLNVGDEILLYYDGKEYRYSLEEKRVVGPNELEAVKNSSADLILQTCWPPGTNWNRLIVFARLIST